MISGYEAFTIYQSIKLHFTSANYDYFKYSGKSKISIESFENRRDKYHFYKLSRRLKSKNELVDFIVANFVMNENTWVGNLLEEQSDIHYRQRQRVIQSLSYVFENDLRRIFDGVDDPNDVLQSENGDYPKLLTLAVRKEIEIETLCILNRMLNFFPMWERKITDTVRWPLFKMKVLKYTPFLPKDDTKYKMMIKKVI